MAHQILIVDDDPAIRSMMVSFLGTIAEVLVAATGEEALRLIAARRPALMLLDMTMPGMSGLDVLNARRDSGSSMTTIMLTSENDIGIAQRCLELGAVEYVTKPFDWPELREKVKRCLGTAKDARNASGVPWKTVAEPSAASAPSAARPPVETGVARWEGEGGASGKEPG